MMCIFTLFRGMNSLYTFPHSVMQLHVAHVRSAAGSGHLGQAGFVWGYKSCTFSMYVCALSIT